MKPPVISKSIEISLKEFGQGISSMPEVWCAHMLDRTAKDFPPDIMEPIIAVIIAASLDVRGKELACVRMS